MKHLTDQELMRIVQAGDHSPASEIYDRYSTRIYNFARRFLQNDELAADATQEAFLKMLRHAATYKETSSLSTWLFAMTKNWCRDHYRRAENQAPQVSDEVLADMPSDAFDGPERRLEQSRNAKDVRDALATLTQEQREAIILYRYQEMSHAEIAKIVGCSVGAVKTRIFRGMELMKEYLTPPPPVKAPADGETEATPAETAPVEETNA